MAAQLAATTRRFTTEQFQEILSWALTPYINGVHTNIERTEENTVVQIREAANQQEKQWGNSMIGQISNGNWTTLLGEGLVHDVLVMRGENPRKPERRSGYEPDWETDDYIYEVKTTGLPRVRRGKKFLLSCINTVTSRKFTGNLSVLSV